MARKRKGRAIDGVLLLDKPLGVSSNHALQHAKRLFFAAKAGHTGSLDPLATGVLPICFGESTKFSQFLLDADKNYRATFVLGEKTTTGDAEGEVLESVDASALTKPKVASAMTQFLGEIDQVPPMYSALKKDGQPLYKLARKGVEVEREARQVEILEYDLLAFRPGVRAEVDVEVHCTKGTYIRSMAEDLGEVLGVGGHVSALRRTFTGGFDETQCISLESLSEERGEGRAETLDHHLLPVDAPIDHLASVELGADGSHFFRMGNPVMDAKVYRAGEEGDMVRVFCESGQFLGVATIEEGRVAPKRLVANRNTAS
ncbi:tRNA pseudouridine(55) synthase TruB [Gilvimarinus agarilyticus]|uniref:tRNA pseudouridine(55) synthase TruB n=1 Tax=unclassified Gilvimarinus TaxID=2642066 RepID=UPI001C08DFBE|nr:MULTISPECIES: tRNA pseudouridine(55) synthase TruB [unclassified Gilvimarinus]MBU2885346.1 tRNA pseudouridine(55) synthase TruB [Gilvimarinus agarilyticus]MDO6570245.1 tRNA pseudouridine(55) synthase TruB [Gilvimarinus sp. 2_MG-2023]MDO6748240.1 tRNA pseudouridine(55) synthase TruB [Gilvimarinus sp. 1_MG-2023]